LKMFKELLSIAAKHNFKYIKAVPYTEIKQMICDTDVVLLPSFAEAFPMTWLEAMALEKKLITSNIGWAEELMIDGETGFTINPKDTDDFTTKVLTLLDKEDEANQMAKNARQRIINKFDIKKSIEENIKLYMSIQ
jgi:glycosyltransferase involved in cell wall biosynthesis